VLAIIFVTGSIDWYKGLIMLVLYVCYSVWEVRDYINWMKLKFPLGSCKNSI